MFIQFRDCTSYLLSIKDRQYLSDLLPVDHLIFHIKFEKHTVCKPICDTFRIITMRVHCIRKLLEEARECSIRDQSVITSSLANLATSSKQWTQERALSMFCSRLQPSLLWLVGAEIAVVYTKKTAQYIPTTHSLEVRASQYFARGRTILKFPLSFGKNF